MRLSRLAIPALASVALAQPAGAGSGEFVCTAVSGAGVTTAGALVLSPARALVSFDIGSGKLRTQRTGSLPDGPHAFTVLSRGFVDRPDCTNCDVLAIFHPRGAGSAPSVIWTFVMQKPAGHGIVFQLIQRVSILTGTCREL